MKTKDGQTAIFVNCEYDDVDAATYKGISIRVKGKKTVFNSGNPNFDFCCAMVHIGALGLADGMIFCGSSIDHFDMDGGDIDTNPTFDKLRLAKDYLILNKALPFKKTKVK